MVSVRELRGISHPKVRTEVHVFVALYTFDLDLAAGFARSCDNPSCQASSYLWVSAPKTVQPISAPGGTPGSYRCGFRCDNSKKSQWKRWSDWMNHLSIKSNTNQSPPMFFWKCLPFSSLQGGLPRTNHLAFQVNRKQETARNCQELMWSLKLWLSGCLCSLPSWTSCEWCTKLFKKKRPTIP